MAGGGGNNTEGDGEGKFKANSVRFLNNGGVSVEEIVNESVLNGANVGFCCN